MKLEELNLRLEDKDTELEAYQQAIQEKEAHIAELILLVRSQKDDINRYQNMVNTKISGRNVGMGISGRQVGNDSRSPYVRSFKSELGRLRSTSPVVLPERAETVYIINFYFFRVYLLYPRLNVKV